MKILKDMRRMATEMKMKKFTLKTLKTLKKPKVEGLSSSVDDDKSVSTVSTVSTTETKTPEESMRIKKKEVEAFLRKMKIPILVKVPRDMKKFPIDPEGEKLLKEQFNRSVDEMHQYFPYCSVVVSCKAMLRNKRYKTYIKELMKFDKTKDDQVTTERYKSVYGEIYFGLDLKIACATSQKYVYQALDELYGGYRKFYDDYEIEVDKYRNRTGRTVVMNIDPMRAKKELCDIKIVLLKKIDDIYQTSFTEEERYKIEKEPILCKMIKLLLTIKTYQKEKDEYNRAYNNARKTALELDYQHYCINYGYNNVTFRVLSRDMIKLSFYQEILEILSYREDSTIKMLEFKDACIQHAIKERKEDIEQWRIGSYIDKRDYMVNEEVSDELEEEY